MYNLNSIIIIYNLLRFIFVCELNTVTLLNIGKTYKGVYRRRIAYQILLFSDFFAFSILCGMAKVFQVSTLNVLLTFLTIDKSCQMAIYVLRFLFTMRPYKINKIILMK